MKHTVKVLAVALALAVLPTLSLADTAFGSAAVDGTAAYTLQQMLTYAMQDEYMAEAEYLAIQQAFGVNNPYSNIIRAEATHQQELAALFAAYGMTPPVNTAANSVSLPATLQETYEIGVTAEINNIAMYKTFLAQGDVPDDVRAVFEGLIAASQSHLEAFTRNAEKTGTGLGNGRQAASAGVSGTQAVRSIGNGNQNLSAACVIDPQSDTAAAQTWQGRGGRNRN